MRLVVLLTAVVVVAGQRSPYAPNRSYPGLLPRFREEELANRNGEPESSTPLPSELEGTLEDDETVRRVAQWPEERQPFWYKNRKVIANQIHTNVDNGGYQQNYGTTVTVQKEKKPFWKQIFNSGARSNKKEIEVVVTQPPQLYRDSAYQKEQTIYNSASAGGKKDTTFHNSAYDQSYLGGKVGYKDKVIHGSAYGGQKEQVHHHSADAYQGHHQKDQTYFNSADAFQGQHHQKDQTYLNSADAYQGQHHKKEQTYVNSADAFQGQHHQKDQTYLDSADAFQGQHHQKDQTYVNSADAFQGQHHQKDQTYVNSADAFEGQHHKKDQVIRNTASEYEGQHQHSFGSQGNYHLGFGEKKKQLPQVIDNIH